MTQINPFTGAFIQSGQVQPRQMADKQRQIRRLQNLGKNAALQGDQLEHQVESSDALHAMGDQDDSNQPQRHPPQQSNATPEKDDDDQKPHVDVTA